MTKGNEIPIMRGISPGRGPDEREVVEKVRA